MKNETSKKLQRFYKPVLASAFLLSLFVLTQNFLSSNDDLTMVIQAGSLDLHSGQAVGKNGLALTLQGDGNLVLSYSSNVLWSTGTQCSNCRAVFQGDGNFVVYGDQGEVLYATGTNNPAGGTFTISAAGPYTQIRDGNGALLWNAFSTPQHDSPNSYLKSTDTWDLVVQMVCELNGVATADDPYRCPAGAVLRKLRVGENLPYHKTDRPLPGEPRGWQISDSYPVASGDGLPRAIHSMIYLSTVPKDMNFEMVTNLQAAYDVMVRSDKFVAGAGTYDQSTGFLPWYSSGCILRDAWVEMPSGPDGFNSGTSKTQIQGTPVCDSSTQYGTTFTSRDRMNFGYSSDANTGGEGRLLDTIRVMHFGGDDPHTANAIEVAYFTRLYGWTRWESWQSLDHIMDAEQLPEDDGRVCTGPTFSDFGFGNRFRRVLCHDWSFPTPAKQGGWETSRFHIDPVYLAYANLLKNTHLMLRSDAMDPWKRLHDDLLNWGFDNTFYANSNQDRAIVFSPIGAPDGRQAIYQDVTVDASDSRTYSFGTLLWTPAGQTAHPTIAIYQNAADGTILDQTTLTPAVDSSRPFYQGTFVKKQGTVNIRFQIYANDQDVVLEMSDGWITPVTGNTVAPSSKGVTIKTIEWSVAQEFVPACRHDRADSDSCATAIHRYCLSQGAASGFGPIENNDHDLTVACLPMQLANSAQANMDQMKTLTPTCDSNNVSTDACLSASDNTCRNSQQLGGFGPVEHSGKDATVTCVNQAVGERRTYSIGTLAALVPTCSDGSLIHSGPCAAAVNRACGADHFASGFPVQHVGPDIEVICTH